MTSDSAQHDVAAVIAAYGHVVRSRDPDPEQYLSLFRDDSVQCTNGGPPRVGKVAMRESILRSQEGRDMSGEFAFEITPEQIDVVGDIATVITLVREQLEPRVAHPAMDPPANHPPGQRHSWRYLAKRDEMCIPWWWSVEC